LPQIAVEAVRASYRRCCEAPEFFPSFYARFFEACPVAKPMFAHTDFERQHRLLRHAIGLLFNFDGKPETEPNILSRVAERHSRRDLNVDPSLYPVFLDSLMAIVKQYDPQFTPELEAAWRQVTAKGVSYMQSKY
jgi:hemoglobin-like flavoprotein